MKDETEKSKRSPDTATLSRSSYLANAIFFLKKLVVLTAMNS